MARRRCITTSTDAVMAYETDAFSLASIENPLIRLYLQSGRPGEFSAVGTLLRSTDYNPETQEGTWTPIATTGKFTSLDSARTEAVAGGPWPGHWGRLALTVEKIPPSDRVCLEVWAEASTYETARNTPPERRHKPHMLDNVFDVTRRGLPRRAVIQP